MEQRPELWRPSQEVLERAHLTRFMAWLGERGYVDAADYGELWRWSTDRIEPFWQAIWDYFEVQASEEATRVLDGHDMPGAQWFPGARLSYAEHIFRDRDQRSTAIHHASELREPDSLTWGELGRRVAAVAHGLRRLGVEPGDRVVAYLPNIAEATVAFLACASIGATWSACSPDFGAASVVDRFAQVEPKVLLAVDGYRYGGRDFDRTETVRELQRRIAGLEHTVLLAYLGVETDLPHTTWDEAFEPTAAPLEFAQLPFDHPLWILYSSGTTGLPKAIVHGQGAILLEHLKKMHLHLDVHPGDRVFWFTTTGWMMWNFLVGVLLTRGQIVLYDGSPGHPDMGVLWDLAQRTETTCFGTSAAYIAACMKAGVEPGGGRDLSALRSVGSTGSPLAPEAFDWIYEHLGRDTWLFSTSGGTDVCTAFVGGCPLLPVHQGELQARSLGAKVEAFGEDGEPRIGEVGELVITEPLPSMPLFLWGDTDGERLRESYFDTFPGVWRHGDWVEITDRGSAVIYGRSDSTINRGGIRMGTSEIYRAVLAQEAVVDALVVDVQRPGEESWMPLFVVLADGAELSAELEREIARAIREACSPRHVPDELFAIERVPRTLSGKVLEVPVKRILSGVSVDDAASRDSLQDPRALDWFAELAAARSS